jgi:hypothetical protein
MIITLEVWRHGSIIATVRTRIHNLHYWTRNMPEGVSASVWFD